jgi:hypothetical protein
MVSFPNLSAPIIEAYKGLPIIDACKGPGSLPFVEPIYPTLEQVLLRGRDPARPNNGPDPISHVLAACAGYAYSDAATLSRTMTGLGLKNTNCLMIQETVDAMSIRSTAFMIQSQTGELGILCYRGTEPVNPLSWLTNIDVHGQNFPFAHFATSDPSDGSDPSDPSDRSDRSDRSDPTVHAGFYRNVEATFPAVLVALRYATQGRSILTGKREVLTGKEEAGVVKLKNLKKLYITGHSLGGAMAVLAAAMLKGGDFPAFPGIDGRIPVYAFAQPMVGNGAFAENCGKLAFDLRRYVYRRDIVPRLPSVDAKSVDAKGNFQHFGTPLFFGCPGEEEKVPPSTEEAQEILAQMAANLLGTGFRAWVENMVEGQPILWLPGTLAQVVIDTAGGLETSSSNFSLG